MRREDEPRITKPRRGSRNEPPQGLGPQIESNKDTTNAATLIAIANTPPTAPPTLAAPLRFAMFRGLRAGSTVAVAVAMNSSHAAIVAAGYW